MTTDIAQHTPGEDPGIEIMRLTSQGLTVKEAARRVNVSERHAYRLTRDLKSGPSRFERWSPSMEVDAPPGKVEWLFETCMEGAWFADEADVAWSLHCAVPDIEPRLVKDLARLYLAANAARPAVGSRNRMIIDRALWHRVWEGDHQVEEFVETLPVFTRDELGFAAEVVRYLERHRAGEADADRPRLTLQTVVEGVKDRREFVDRALKEMAARDEVMQSRAVEQRKLPAVHVPGEITGRRQRAGRGRQ